MLFRFLSLPCNGRILAVAVAAFLSGPLAGRGDEPLPVVDFERTVKPLFERYCYDCHNAKTTKGELDLAGFADGDALAADAERLSGMLEVVSEAAKMEITLMETRMMAAVFNPGVMGAKLRFDRRRSRRQTSRMPTKINNL